MGRVKFNINGKGVAPASGNRYAGPDLPKGSYTCRIKRATMEKIKSMGENKGAPRLNILLEVRGGAGANGIGDADYEYLGAPIWDGLNIISSSVAFVNAFLHGLTDGSDAEKRAVETSFWDEGPFVKTVTNEKTGEKSQHVTRIGKYKIDSPNGEHLIQVTTKAGKDLKQQYRPEVTGYQPYTGDDRPKSSTDEVEDDDDLLDAETVEDDDVDDDGDVDYDDDGDTDNVDADTDDDAPAPKRKSHF